MGIITTTGNETFEIVYYTIPGENGREIHKRVNLEVKRDLFGNPTSVTAYGTWRRGGFWTKKDFAAEDPVKEMISYLDGNFDTNTIQNENKFYETKERCLQHIEKEFKEKMVPLGAKLIRIVPYGTAHEKITIGNDRKGDTNVGYQEET